MNLYNVTARQKDRPLVLQGPGWHNVFWRQIWKIIFMYRMRRISIIRITGLLIHAEILGFVFDFCPFRMCFIFYLWSSPQTFPVILAFLHIFAGFKQFLFQKILNTTQSCICIQDLSKTLHHQTCGTYRSDLLIYINLTFSELIILRWYGTSSNCYILRSIEIDNKIKYNFLIFSFMELLPNNVAQWIRVFTTKLIVMSSNSAGAFINFSYPKIFKINFS